MKTTHHKTFVTAVLLLGSALALPAATLYWDGGTADIAGNGNGASDGSDGAWDTTIVNWDNGSAVPHVAWNNANNDTATFAGTVGAVTVGVPVTANALTFNVGGGYTLSGAAISLGAGGIASTQTSGTTTIGNDLALQAAQTWSLSGGTLNINGSVSGSANLTRSGSGTLALSSANTFIGDTILAGATTTLAADNAINNAGILYFGSSAGQNASAIINVNGNASVGGLTARMNNATACTANLAATKTLTVNGNVWVGSSQTSATSTKLTLTGASGTLAVNNSGGSIRVGSTSAYSAAVLDLSTLGTFTADLGSTGNVFVGTDTSWNGNGSGQSTTLTLAAATTITAGALSISAHDLAAIAFNNTVNLGTSTNVLNLNSINFGPFENSGNPSRSTTAILQFLNSNGTVKLRAADGSGRANLAVGTVAKAFCNITAIANFNGHDSDLLVSTLTLGQFTASGTSSGSYPATGTLSFNSGTLDVTSVVIGNNTVTNGSATGTLNIGGGSVAIGTGGITIGGTTNGTGTLNFTGGTITVGGAITRVGSASIATLTLDGATLDMAGFAIGGATSISNLNFLSGTLKNVGQINNGATNLNKTGAGTLTLDGINTYTGNTLVSAGTLALADNADLKFVITDASNNLIAGTLPNTVTLDGAFTIDTSAVTVTSGSWTLVDVANLGVTFTPNFTVNGFIPNVDGVTWTKPAGSQAWSFSEATGVLTLVTGGHAYVTWAQTHITDINPSADASQTGDPDRDGANNLLEFALAGDPLGGANNGISLAKVQDVDGTPALTLTIAVRAGATFAPGSDSPNTQETTVDGTTYRIEGATALGIWSDTITEVTPAIPLPAPNVTPPAGYEYHTFMTAGPVSGTPADFIRVKVTAP